MLRRVAFVLMLPAIACGGRTGAPSGTTEVVHPEPVPAEPEPAVVEGPPRPEAPPEEPAAVEPPVGALTTAPAPNAPGVPGAPVTNLVPWDAGVTLEGRRAVVDGEGPLVLVDASRFVAVSGDGTTETRVRDNPVGYTPVFADSTLGRVPVASGVFLVRGEGDRVAGVDRETLAVRWTRTIGAVPGSREAHLSSGDAFVVVVDEELLALDPESGETLWRAEVRRSMAQQRWRAADGLVFWHDGELRARDARTGEVRWEASGLAWDARLFDVAAGRLPVLARHRELVLLDVSDGSVQATVDFGEHVPAGRNLVIDGDVAYATSDTRGRNRSLHVTAWDLRRGRRLWQSPPMAMDGTGFHPSLGLDDDSVVVCTNHWTAQALDRRSGRPVWAGHPPSCRLPTTWRPRADAPNVLLFAPGPDTAFARAADTPARRRVTVSGRITCGGEPAFDARVWVGEQRVRTRRDGRYRATVHAAESVPVFVHQHSANPFSFCSSERRSVPVGGARVTADFELRLNGHSDQL